MDTQMINGKKNFINQNGETFGFNSEDYQTFVTAYSELSYAMAHNDYNMVSLFSLVREQLGKKNFFKFLTAGLHLSPSEISDINRKLAAYQQIPNQIIWNTIGYRGVQKIVSMSTDTRGRLLQDISDHGDNLTLKEFYSLYSKYSKKSGEKSSGKGERNWKNDKKNDKKLSDRSDDVDTLSDERISLTRSDLERIVRRSVESVMSPSMGKRAKHGKRNGKDKSKLSRFTFQPMTV